MIAFEMQTILPCIRCAYLISIDAYVQHIKYGVCVFFFLNFISLCAFFFLFDIFLAGSRNMCALFFFTIDAVICLFAPKREPIVNTMVK